MKKMKKCVLLLVLSLLLQMSCVFSVHAIQNESLPDALEAKISELLFSVYPEKELYGLDENDYSNLMLGTEIYTYQVTTSGLEQQRIYVIPVLAKSGLYKSLIWVTDNDGEYNIQISKQYVEILNGMTKAFSQVAIVYDDTAMYCWVDGTLSKINSYERVIFRESMETVEKTAIESLKGTVAGKKKYEMQVGLSRSTRASVLDNISLNVSVYTQPAGSMMCWACCVATTGNYITNLSYTPNLILSKLGIGTNVSADLATTITVMKELYGVSYSRFTSVNQFTSANILAALQNGKPVLGGFVYGGSVGHMVVIRAINTGAYTFSVADSELGSYVAGTYLPMGSFKYTRVDIGVELALNEYGAP